MKKINLLVAEQYIYSELRKRFQCSMYREDDTIFIKFSGEISFDENQISIIPYDNKLCDEIKLLRPINEEELKRSLEYVLFWLSYLEMA